MARQFTWEKRGDIAVVTWDSGTMNTLGTEAVAELGVLVGVLENEQGLRAVVLRGNTFGLGAGANVFELARMSRGQLADLVSAGHAVLYGIERSSVPWFAFIDGLAFGGVFELALACRGIAVTERSTVGLPEVALHIMPGLGGTQRLPRRIGYFHPDDPVNGLGAVTAVLEGRRVQGEEAFASGMVDFLLAPKDDVATFAEAFIGFPELLLHERPKDLDWGHERIVETARPILERVTKGRENPRAPHVALDAMLRGGSLPLEEGIEIEEKSFLELANSHEGQAGLRLFCAEERAKRLPKGFPGKPRNVQRVGVAGGDGKMGSAIAYLFLRAGCQVVVYVPFVDLVDKVPDKIRVKYAPLLKKEKITPEAVAAEIDRLMITADVAHLAGCNFVVEALLEKNDVKDAFFGELAIVLPPDSIAASNSSSMNPSDLSPAFEDGGGDKGSLINAHFFSPAENPKRKLVEIVVGENTHPDVVATAHTVVKALGKVPIIVKDGSIGFLVNAGLLAYYLEAERLFLEGTPMNTIDAAMRDVFPMGPFELADYAGIGVYALIFDEMKRKGVLDHWTPLVWILRSEERMGVEVTRSGFYNYDKDGKNLGFWNGINGHIPPRRNRVASDDEIRTRCLKALHDKAIELLDGGVVATAAECDLAFVHGIGYASHLGGPIFDGFRRGWNHRPM